MEETLLFTHALFVLVVGEPAKKGLAGVNLRRRSGKSAVPFSKLTNVRLRSTLYALRYDREAVGVIADRPNREDLTYEAVLRKQIELLREIEGRPTALSDQVLTALREGAESQEEVAAALDMSSATLRRRLAEEGQRFRDLRAEMILERADTLLATNMPLADVALRLGFSDLRSFNRAYRTWRGVTPAKARKG
jgi:AraC-like DNA-binding protein